MKRDVLAEVGDALDQEIDRAFAGSRNLRRLGRDVVAAQKALKRITTREAWQAYLTIEAAVNAREGERMRVLARRLKRTPRESR